MGLFVKNDAKEYKDLESLGAFLDSLILSDDYISRKSYLKPYNELLNTYKELSLLEERSVLQAWCKSNKVDYKMPYQLLGKYKNFHQQIKKHNEEYVKRHLEIDKQYLDEVLHKDDPKIKLDEEQRRVVLLMLKIHNQMTKYLWLFFLVSFRKIDSYEI